ncbi:hypothetical protein Tco_0411153 [Tanacetum coccineum]
MYYQNFRGDGSSKNYKILSEMLEDFDRQDVEKFNSYADREEIPSKSRDAVKDVKSRKMFERIIRKGRRLEDLIQKKLDDLKDNHKFRRGLLGINLYKT